MVETNTFEVKTYCPSPTKTNIADNIFIVSATSPNTVVYKTRASYLSSTSNGDCIGWTFTLQQVNADSTFTTYSGNFVTINAAGDVSVDKT